MYTYQSDQGKEILEFDKKHFIYHQLVDGVDWTTRGVYHENKEKITLFFNPHKNNHLLKHLDTKLTPSSWQVKKQSDNENYQFDCHVTFSENNQPVIFATAALYHDTKIIKGYETDENGKLIIKWDMPLTSIVFSSVGMQSLEVIIAEPGTYYVDIVLSQAKYVKNNTTCGIGKGTRPSITLQKHHIDNSNFYITPIDGIDSRIYYPKKLVILD